MELQELIWLVPLLPFAGFLVNGLIGGKLPKLFVSLIGCGTVLVSFAIAVQAFLHVKAGAPFVSASIPWIQVSGLEGGALGFLAEHKLGIDGLACVMMLVVTGVGSLIHIYSVGYMADDKRYARYFAYLNLFTGFMLILVMASNLFLMFVGWEGVGLCSYLLIGFWFEKEENARAGRKAFIVNRIGDLSFTIGVLLLFVTLGDTFGVWTVDIATIRETLKANPGIVSVGILTLIGILLFGGACGKSAQIPLYVWLPDAMAGPTPVSALIHAATMVTAGVYMVARMGFLYELAPNALLVVAVIGGVTALFAGTIAFCQNDIKKVLAYSTVSQLGFMFMGVGSGFFFAGIFHLMTHAFFKACLFLGSGSVIHGMGGEQDIRKMGALFRKMPITAVTFIISALALAGLPIVTAGFWSKEAVLGAVWESEALSHSIFPWIGPALALLGFAAAGCTAFYMTRLVYKTFFGEPRWQAGESGGPALPDWMEEHGGAAHKDEHAHDAGHHGEPHESPLSMTGPLMILAVLSIIGGFVWFFDVGKWLASEEIVHHAHGPWFFWVLSIAASVGGILLGAYFYAVRKDLPEKIARENPGLYDLVLYKYKIDEMYENTVVAFQIHMNEAAGRFDNAIIDGAVNGAAGVTASTSQSTGYFDNEVVDGGVNAAGAAVRRGGQAVRKLQTGNIKGYLTSAIVGGLFVIASFCVYLSWGKIREMLGW